MRNTNSILVYILIFSILGLCFPRVVYAEGSGNNSCQAIEVVIQEIGVAIGNINNNIIDDDTVMSVVDIVAESATAGVFSSVGMPINEIAINPILTISCFWPAIIVAIIIGLLIVALLWYLSKYMLCLQGGCGSNGQNIPDPDPIPNIIV